MREERIFIKNKEDGNKGEKKKGEREREECGENDNLGK